MECLFVHVLHKQAQHGYCSAEIPVLYEAHQEAASTGQLPCLPTERQGCADLQPGQGACFVFVRFSEAACISKMLQKLEHDQRGGAYF